MLLLCTWAINKHMNVNATLLSEIILFSIFIVGALSYYLGRRKIRRKVSTSEITTLMGVMLCITPPLNTVYLTILMLKNDAVPNSDVKNLV
jgi:hypothetical protein